MHLHTDGARRARSTGTRPAGTSSAAGDRRRRGPRHRLLATATVALSALVTVGLAPAAVPTLSPAAAQPADPRPPSPLCPTRGPATELDDRGDISDGHLDAVDCLFALGVTDGLGSDVGVHYLPHGEVRRDQMASFVVDMLDAAGAELPAGDDGRFGDVSSDNVHRESIERLAGIGVVRGTSADTYDPDAAVSRAAMASFLVRATAWYQDVGTDELTGGPTRFDDLGANVHTAAIAGAYHLGITQGVSSDATGARYAPADTVTREQMASFLVATSRAMLADPSRCSDPTTGYALTMPQDWATNPGDVLASCRVFDTGRFALDQGTEIDFARPVRLVASDSDLSTAAGPADRDELGRRQLTVDGRDALRVEARTTEDSDELLPAGVEVTTYAIELPDGAPASTLVATTTDLAEDYAGNQDVLDEMIESLVFEVPGRVEVADYAGGGRPFSVHAFASHDGLCTQALVGDTADTVCVTAADMDELEVRSHRIDTGWTIHAGSVDATIDAVEVVTIDGDTFTPPLVQVAGRQTYAPPVAEERIETVRAMRDGNEVVSADLPSAAD